MESEKAASKDVVISLSDYDISSSVKKVLKRIDTNQLLRAKQEISERLGEILKRVNLALEHYASAIEPDMMESEDITTISKLLDISKRKELMYKLSMFLQTSSAIEGGLENILKWLLEWSETLTDINSEYLIEMKWKRMDEWIEKQEAEIIRCLDATQKCIMQLTELYFIMTGHDLRMTDVGKEVPVEEPEIKLDMTYVLKIQGIKLPSTGQMLQNEESAILMASQLFHLLHEIAVSPQCSEEQGSIYLCISIMTRNLSKAFDLRSKEYHELEKELSYLRAQKRKYKNQLINLLKDFHQMQEDRKLLQLKLNGMEGKLKQLLASMKSMQTRQDAEKVGQMVMTEKKKSIIDDKRKKSLIFQVIKESISADTKVISESELQSIDGQWPVWEYEKEATVIELEDKKELKIAASQEMKILSTVAQKKESETKPVVERDVKPTVDTKRDFRRVESEIKAALEGKKGFLKGLKKPSAHTMKAGQKQDRVKDTAVDGRKRILKNDKATQTDLDDAKEIERDKEAKETALVDGEGIQRDTEAKETALVDGQGIQRDTEAKETALVDEQGIRRDTEAIETALVDGQGIQRDTEAIETALVDGQGIRRDTEAIETALVDGQGIQRDTEAIETALVDGQGIQRDTEAIETALVDGQGIQRDTEAKETDLVDGKEIKRVEDDIESTLVDGKRIRSEDKVMQTGLDVVTGIKKIDKAEDVLDKKTEFQRSERGTQTVQEDRREIQKYISDLQTLLDIRREYLKGEILSPRDLLLQKKFQEDEYDAEPTLIDQEREIDIKDEELVVTALEGFERLMLSFLDLKADTSRRPSEESLQAQEILPKNEFVQKIYSMSVKKMEEIVEKMKENIHVELKEKKPLTPRLSKSTLDLKAEDLKYLMLPEQPDSSLPIQPTISTMPAEPEVPCTVLSSEPPSASQDLAYLEISQQPRLEKADEPPLEDKSTRSKEQLQKQPEEDHLPFRTQDMDQALSRPHQLLPALETKTTEVVSAVEGDYAAYKERLSDDETILLLTQPEMSVQQLEEEWLSAKIPEKKKRYSLDVKSQRENLELLSKASRMLVLPSPLHALAKNLILQILDIDVTRLAHLFRKYISFRLIQNVRQIVTIRANKARTTGDVTAVVGLYLFLERLDSYQAKIIHRWVDKQATTAETRSSCLSKMSYLFNKLRVNYKLQLFQPFLTSQFEQVKLEDYQSPYKQRLSPLSSPFQHFKSTLPVIDQDSVVSRLRSPKYKMNTIWKPDTTDESLPIGKKKPVLSVWSKVGAFPDVPRLLQLDVQLSQNKALQSVQMRIQECSK